MNEIVFSYISPLKMTGNESTSCLADLMLSVSHGEKLHDALLPPSEWSTLTWMNWSSKWLAIFLTSSQIYFTDIVNTLVFFMTGRWMHLLVLCWVQRLTGHACWPFRFPKSKNFVQLYLQSDHSRSWPNFFIPYYINNFLQSKNVSNVILYYVSASCTNPTGWTFQSDRHTASMG